MYRREAILKQSVILIAGALLVCLLIYQHYVSRKPLMGHYTIGVILNNLELSPKDMEVTQLVIKRKVDQINKQGGINGRELRVKYLDDKGSNRIARQVVQETMQEENLIGYVGCWSSTRSKAISEIIGPARIPFIGGYALTPLFKAYPTMFTSEQGIKNVSARFDLLL